MNGPEHYRQAEQLLSGLIKMERGAVAEAGTIAEAQVHATLALAAALAGLVPINPPLNTGSILGRSDDEVAEWDEALS